MAGTRRRAPSRARKEVPAPRRQAEVPRRGELLQVLQTGGPRIVYQPQLSLAQSAVAGYEALARFPDEGPGRGGPENWFTLAHAVGLGARLEAAAVQNALAARSVRPDGTTLAINLSPVALMSGPVAQVLPADLSGLEIELTEHAWLTDDGRLRGAIDALRERGARIAIDDVGVAHSGLRRVMELAPDRIKIDRHLVGGVSTSTAKAALIRAIVDFAEHIRCDVCAEGVEDVDDLEALADLDVGFAQGWLIGTPEATFADVAPVSVGASQESLRSILAGEPDTLQLDPAAGVEHLLTRLTTVTDLDTLADLAAGYAGVLGADQLVISVVSPDGSGVRALTCPFHDGPPEDYRLDEYPVTAAAVARRELTPIQLDVAGDEAEWAVLRRLGFDGLLLVPVVSRDRVIGLLECYREGDATWSRRQIRSARTVAATLGPVLDVLLARL